MNKNLIILLIALGIIVLLTVVVINTRIIKQTERGEAANLTIEEHSAPDPYNKTEKKPSNLRQPLRNDREKAEMLLLLNKAYTAMAEGNLPLAENHVKTVLIFEPDNYSALSLLGRIFYTTKNFSQAEAVFRRQSELNGSDAHVYNNLGQTMAKQNKFDEAIKSMNIAAGLDPESPFIALNLSGMYSVTGDKVKSIKYFKKAFERLGEQIVPISYDPTLNNIRDEPEFRQIIDGIATRKKDVLGQAPRQE